MGLCLALAACGYRFHLPEHGPQKTAAIQIREGEKRRVLSAGFNPIKVGYKLSLSSENPEVADVLFKDGNTENIWIVAKAPGQTVFHYGNFYSQTYPFGKYEGDRLGVLMPADDYEKPGAGEGWPRHTWLRKDSAGKFAVEVMPRNP